MYKYFDPNYTDETFHLFYLPHIVAICTVILVIIFAINYLRIKGTGTHKLFRYTLASIVILMELLYNLVYILGDKWTIQIMLPFHLCGIMTYISVIVLITKNRPLYEYLYLLGIGGAIQPLLTPEIGDYGYPHILFFQTFIAHGSIIAAGIYMTVIEKYRPYWKSMFRVFIGSNIYMLFVGVLNFFIKSNYMYIAHKPLTPSLIDYLGPWPLYIIGLEVIAFITYLILYMPFIIKDYKNKTIKIK